MSKKNKSKPVEKIRLSGRNIYTDKKGRFVDEKNNQRKFPTGFFDATLTEYLQIYR